MTWVVLIIAGIIWLIVKGSKGVSSISSTNQKNQSFLNRRDEKYKDRVIDTSKSLFDRNTDIIKQFELKVTGASTSYRYYETDNITRDCINEIALAENKMSVSPDHKYLSQWIGNAPAEWSALAKQIKSSLDDSKYKVSSERNRLDSEKRKIQDEKTRRDNKIAIEERMVKKARESFEFRKRQQNDPAGIQEINKTKGSGEMYIEYIRDILTPNEEPWCDIESDLISANKEIPVVRFPHFTSSVKLDSVVALNEEIDEFNQQLEEDAKNRVKNSSFFSGILSGYEKGDKESMISRINLIVDGIELPKAVPRVWNVDFDPIESIAIVEVMLPDVVHTDIYKKVTLKSGIAKKELNQREKKDEVPSIHPAIILRIAYELFRNDIKNQIKLLVLNGWVEFDDPNTGVKTKTYTSSLVVEKDKIMALNLSKLDPLSAFTNLKGKSAGKLIDIIPVTPMMSLDKKDKRFIETKEVLNKLGSETNLAAMDWQDFESLIAELFEKEFASEGGEVKVTQASRDRGVDAVVFIPDPIKGGKYIIQAKRYTNTVDVSAVRDLCAVVKKEGASKGILVTTSTYGSDAYAFAQNEPITLLNGAELLGLLAKHNYKFRINLSEAKKINIANSNYKKQ